MAVLHVMRYFSGIPPMRVESSRREYFLGKRSALLTWIARFTAYGELIMDGQDTKYQTVNSRAAKPQALKR